jgi:hypothetical protein
VTSSSNSSSTSNTTNGKTTQTWNESITPVSVTVEAKAIDAARSCSHPPKALREATPFDTDFHDRPRTESTEQSQKPPMNTTTSNSSGISSSDCKSQTESNAALGSTVPMGASTSSEAPADTELSTKAETLTASTVPGSASPETAAAKPIFQTSADKTLVTQTTASATTTHANLKTVGDGTQSLPTVVTTSGQLTVPSSTNSTLPASTTDTTTMITKTTTALSTHPSETMPSSLVPSATNKKRKLPASSFSHANGTAITSSANGSHSTATTSPSTKCSKSTLAMTQILADYPILQQTTTDMLALLQLYGPLTAAQLEYNLPPLPPATQEQQQSLHGKHVHDVLQVLVCIGIVEQVQEPVLPNNVGATTTTTPPPRYVVGRGGVPRPDVLTPQGILDEIQSTQREIEASVQRSRILQAALQPSSIQPSTSNATPHTNSSKTTARAVLQELLRDFPEILYDPVYLMALKNCHVDVGGVSLDHNFSSKTNSASARSRGKNTGSRASASSSKTSTGPQKTKTKSSITSSMKGTTVKPATSSIQSNSSVSSITPKAIPGGTPAGTTLNSASCKPLQAISTPSTTLASELSEARQTTNTTDAAPTQTTATDQTIKVAKDTKQNADVTMTMDKGEELTVRTGNVTTGSVDHPTDGNKKDSAPKVEVMETQ